jgi:hypothetical protein
VIPLDRFDHVTRRQVIERDHRRTRIPRRKQLVLPIIERQRQHREHAVGRRQPQVMRHADRAEPQVGVAQHHAFGPPGRSAGVENRRQIVRRGAAWRQPLAERFGFGPYCGFLAAGRSCTIARLQRRQPRGARNQQNRAAVRQNMRDLRALEQRVDRHMHQPRAHRRERHQAGQLAFGQPRGHPCARFRRHGPQPAREQAYTRI